MSAIRTSYVLPGNDPGVVARRGRPSGRPWASLKARPYDGHVVRTFVAGVFLLLASVSHAAPVAGVLSAVRGTVEVHRGAAWTGVSKGAFLYEGDKLRVGPRSVCALTLISGVEIKLNAGALFEVPAREAGDRSGFQRAKLNHGGAWARWLGASGRKFEMRTPTATIGVRGTEWGVEAEDTGTEVACFSGSVEVGNAFGAVVLKPGEKTSAGAGAAPAPPEKLKEEEKKEKDWTKEVKGRGTLKVTLSLGSPKPGEAVTATVEAVKGDGKPDTASPPDGPGEVGLVGDGVEVSVDGGATWAPMGRAKLDQGAGKFQFRRATPGNGQVGVSADGYPSTLFGVTVSAGGKKAGKAVKVRVRLADGTEQDLILHFKKD